MTSAAPAAPFGRMLTAMATPFGPDGSLDLDGVQKVAKHLVAHGHDGLVVSGTTGESPTTLKEEDGEILAAVRDAVGPGIKLVAGVGTNDTATSTYLAKQAGERGADGVLLVSPYYNKPGQRGMVAHFRQVVDAAEIPVMLYDVPGRTGSIIALESYAEMAGWEQVVAVKDATGEIPRTARLVQLGYAVYSGDDANTLGYLAHGACGLVSVVGHAAGKEIASMIDTFLAGDHAGALETYQRLVPAFDAVMGVPNYGATTAKASLELLGVLDNRRVRSPLVELDDDELAALRAGLTAAGLL
ncbi:4-hydroxy-tetrahydrodipicolinate synthase [Nocardioides sp. MAH-18]|uniref:4-hydroxy-tetrahydrodipicolinate synthase n=1 Tax=Nocardioides agri TaxID=2682843 RepID=A0A6L6XLR7_9ACTN|nr:MULTISPECIES: 4-hydroxy-tetrahydrodipicolinate synthase [unclassified Nocardioides]MBA2953161.1 4-hydroxy-tetrahydrodipicolinate synthase [Nocardioides sp. CGMCC 1.13656]MVQ48030.1 4-hydroxy-tetrahydrodipicolinate synthase [Nocardioides sp. MAH-18]